MSLYRRSLAALARWAAAQTNQQILPEDGAALILSQHSPMRVVLPEAEVFASQEAARSALMMVAGAGVILREHKRNLTLYEGLVEAAEELGFGPDAGRTFAGSLINPGRSKP